MSLETRNECRVSTTLARHGDEKSKQVDERALFVAGIQHERDGGAYKEAYPNEHPKECRSLWLSILW